ncbi:hypothetical protein BVI2075_320143 [Burkholderia vietnamiensis]|nr:hypothetical protein BVI2075_320143 [Burkholderia vietnamiensis]CAG9211423.1 hypothetical protein BVI1335_220092 [Burkholderia vietnamiensis]
MRAFHPRRGRADTKGNAVGGDSPQTIDSSEEMNLSAGGLACRTTTASTTDALRYAAARPLSAL